MKTIALFACSVSLLAQSLQVSFGDRGVSTLTYGEQTLVNAQADASDSFQIGEIRRMKPDGTVVAEWGGTGAQIRTGASQYEYQSTYAWGTVTTQYAPSLDRLDLTILIRNTHPTDTVLGMNVFPFAIRLPNLPEGAAPNVPIVVFNQREPGVVAAAYQRAAMWITTTDSQPLFMGFFPGGNDPGPAKRYAVWLSSTPLSYAPTFWPSYERPIAPGMSDTFHVSLRFAPVGVPPNVVAPEAFQIFAARDRDPLNWPDRRPISMLMLSSHEAASGSNVRGWTFDSDGDLSTAAARTRFRGRLMAYAQNSIRILKDVDAQGMILWDVEGQEHPHPISYVGDPSVIERLAPEMDEAADEFFAAFRAAGLRVGVGIRPQQFSLDGTQAAQAEVSDPAAQLIRKISYAKSRWGATLFYIDSNGGPNSAMDANILDRVHRAHPDVLLVPEHETFRYHAYSAPFNELQSRPATTPEIVYSVYPHAASVVFVPADPNYLTRREELLNAVRRGDILMFRGWFDDPVSDFVKNVYRSAIPN